MALLGGKFLVVQPIVFDSGIVSIGDFITLARGPNSTVVGPGSTTLSATSTGSVAVGFQCSVTGPNNTVVGQQNLVAAESEDVVVVGRNCVQPVKATTVVMVGTDIINQGSSTGAALYDVAAGSNITLVTDHSFSVAVGRGLQLVNPLGGSHIVAIGDSTALSGSGIVTSYVVSIGSTRTIVSGADVVAIGHGMSLLAGPNLVIAIGAAHTLNDRAAKIVMLGDSITGGTDATELVVAGSAVTFGNSTTRCVLIGRNINVPANSTLAVAIGDQAHAHNASVAIGPDAMVASGGADPGNNVAIGWSVSVGTDCQGATAIAASLIGNTCVDCVGISLGRVFAGSSYCAALASSTVATGSNNSLAVSFSTVGAGCANCVALAAGLISDGVQYGLAAMNSSVTGNAGIAIGNATAGANEMVVGGTIAADCLHSVRFRGFNGASLDTFRAIDNPTSGSTGITLVHNDSVTTANKIVRASATPPVGAIYLYVDP